ncbi:hypothetical protein REH65_28235 [Saccharopolyspora sp. ID03-671]|uniref:hypothetical protein n=1 Tax=Saccharopolyspora sp. ID03-671 TaxID=3073066 RepID=UPI003251C3A5
MRGCAGFLALVLVCVVVARLWPVFSVVGVIAAVVVAVARYRFAQRRAEQRRIAEAITSHEQAVRFWHEQIDVAATPAARDAAIELADFNQDRLRELRIQARA